MPLFSRSLSYHPQIQPKSPWSPAEKIIAGIAVLALAGGLIGFTSDRLRSTIVRPTFGGTYTEGIIADNPLKADLIVSRFTNIGLTYTENDSTIQPALAESWDTSDDKKQYTFHLRAGYNAESLITTIQSSKTSWTDSATITAPSESTLQFALKDPQPAFLATTTTPLFPFGPYKVVKRDKNDITLMANQEFALGQPYIQKIVIKQYTSAEQLLKAAKEGEIDGSSDFADTPPRSFEEHVAKLPRYYVLFFNTSHPNLKKPEDRQRILAASDGPPVTYNLLTTQFGLASELATTFARNLAMHGITLNVIKKNSLELQKNDIPKRNYDLLLYAIQYGSEPDYYPFWHSSQTGESGLNLGNVKDKDLDKLLEASRRETDGVKRSELNRQIETTLQNKSLMKIMDQETFQFWVKPSLKGATYDTITDSSDRFNRVWQWYLKTKKVKASQK